MSSDDLRERCSPIVMPGDYPGTYLKPLRVVFGENTSDQARRFKVPCSTISSWQKNKGPQQPTLDEIRASYGLPDTALPVLREKMFSPVKIERKGE